jgi:cytochrome c oxidase assembly factor CtaG
MNSTQFFVTDWKWDSILLLVGILALTSYFIWFHGKGRSAYLAGAAVVLLIALASPLATLAEGYLFSAHMLQHILLVLIVPALLLMSLPRSVSLPRWAGFLTHPFIGWSAGVGAMWLWHAPLLCNAANSSRPIFVLETVSLVMMGTLFWWQIIAPRERDRLSPLAGIAYLFTACTACSVLGIIITFAPVAVCPVFQHPADKLGVLPAIRNDWGLTSERDQQIGGLLMWVPMCLIYATAILMQLARFHSNPANEPERYHA